MRIFNKILKSKIRTKLTIIMILCIVTGLGSLMLLVMSRVKPMIETRDETIVESTTSISGRTVEIWLNDLFKSLSEIRTVLNSMDLTKEQELEYLSRYVGVNSNYPDGVYIGYSDGTILEPSGTLDVKGYDATTRPWYLEGLTHYEKFEFGSIYYDEYIDSYVVSVSAKLEQRDGLDRIACVDVIVDNISTNMLDMVFSTSINQIIDLETMDIIAHQNHNYIGKRVEINSEDPYLSSLNKAFMSQIKDKIKDNKSIDAVSSVTVIADDSSTDVIEMNGIEYYVYLDPLADTNWIFVSYTPKADLSKDLDKLMTTCTIISIVLLLVFSFIIYITVYAIVKPIEVLTYDIDNIDNNNTNNLKMSTNRKDEIGLLYKAFNKFSSNINSIFVRVSNISNELNNNSKELNSISVELNTSAMAQDSLAISMNNSLSEISSSIVTVAVSAGELSDVVIELEKNTNSITEDIIAITDKSSQGKSDMEDISSSIVETTANFTELARAINSVHKATKSITDILYVLDSITEQTTLLSLNASIEAARAGEAGRGFSVVADEIRKLSDSSVRSSKDIKDVVNNIIALVEESREKAGAAARGIQITKSTINNSVSTFSDIYYSVDSIKNRINILSDSVKDIESVSISMASVTEEQSAGVDEVVKAFTEIIDSSAKLLDIAEVVNKQVTSLDVVTTMLIDTTVKVK